VKILLSILLLLLFTPQTSGAQTIPGNITLDEGGRIWIEGTAGPVNFSCRAKQLSGQGEINNRTAPELSVQQKGEVRITLSLPVKSLDCGKKAMNQDMYEALKAEQFPSISYQLLEASQIDKATASADTLENWITIETRGIMEIAGIQDTVSVVTHGKILDGNRFQVKGSKPIHMDTFNIKPPSKMFGLIRVNKNLSVHFDVTVSLVQN